MSIYAIIIFIKKTLNLVLTNQNALNNRGYETLPQKQ